MGINKNLWVYDIETYKEAFILCAKNIDTLEKIHFEISFRKNDILKLINHYKSIKGQIGYNNIEFDYPVVHWLLNNYKKYTTPQLILAIQHKAQEIIETDGYTGINKNIIIPQLDLYRIWHFNNVNKATSLKWIEFVLRKKNIEDLPFDINESLTSDMIDELIIYCYYDVEITFEFYQLTIGNTSDSRFEKLYKGKDKISFRILMTKEYNTNFMNANDVKIGEEINKITYLKLTGKKWWDIKDRKTNRGLISVQHLIPSYIIYKSPELQKLYDYIWDKQINCYNPKLEYIFEFANNTWKFALGGIHTVDTPRMVIPLKGQRFNERDVGSMYPNKIIEAIHPDFKTKGLYPAHLGIEWLVGYKNNRDIRLDLKSLPDKTSTDTQRIEIIKLSLNGGGYGKTGEETNWQFDPLVKYTTTIQCQLDIMLLADMLWETGVIQIESGNTDGINILYGEEYDELIESICTEWEKITSAQLETTEYSKVIRTSVNDYMAFKPNGSVKLKGDFEVEKEIHKNHSQRIVPLAINNYFIDGVPIEDTIYNSTDIYDFCKAVKGNKNISYIDRSWSGSNWEVIELQRRVNRYIVVNKGSKLIKIMNPLYNENGTQKKDKLDKYRHENPDQLDLFHFIEDVVDIKDREFEIESGYYTKIMNRIDSEDIKDYDINYKYYINECNKLINSII